MLKPKRIFRLKLIMTLMIMSFQVGFSQSIQRYITIADSRVYVEQHGTQGPALVLLHAGNMDHRMWEKQVEVFRLSHRVFTLDIRGCGKKMDGDSAYLQVEAVRMVLDSFHVQAATFIGVSLGAVVATSFALEYPSRVEKLVLTSPGMIGMPLGTDSLLAHYNEQMSAAYQKGDMEVYIRGFIGAWVDGHRRPDEMSLRIRSEAVAMIRENVLKRKPGIWPNFRQTPTQAERISELKMPILIIVGDSDMNDITMVADKYRSIGAVVKRMSFAGHMVNMEMPGEYNAVVLGFLK